MKLAGDSACLTAPAVAAVCVWILQFTPTDAARTASTVEATPDVTLAAVVAMVAPKYVLLLVV